MEASPPKHDEIYLDHDILVLSRRALLRVLAATSATALILPRELLASISQSKDTVDLEKCFPYFQSTPVPYLNVRMTDTFWAPRQKTTRETSVSWITKAHDRTGGLDVFRAHPEGYRAAETVVNMEAIKFIEAMATIVGLERDSTIEGLTDAWIKTVLQKQGTDGYLEEHFPPGLDHPPHRWEAVWWSHEAYTTGHYIESAIAYREATGNNVMFKSAVRAANNMVTELLDGEHPYTSGHPEIEQALMRLYEVTGEKKYLQLCGWLLEQRGRHERRPSFGWMRLDNIPVKDQRAIQGHAVMAAYLWNGVAQYVAATGNPTYLQALLSVWDDLVTRKMYIHGGSGNQSSRIEGYRKAPYCILPGDAYCESCSVFANFQWAHNLARLTGEAHYVNTAERMLYNAFYASLALKGDASFYCNVTQVDVPTPRDPKLARSCCPPNIVKLFNKVGGFFYSTDAENIYINHYGASEADIPWGKGLIKLTQQTEYPWDGAVTILVQPNIPATFALRLRLPEWVHTYTLSVNGKPWAGSGERGWLVVRRHWTRDDQITLNLPMDVRRVTMPPEFKEYENRVALARGPIIYCLEEQDLEVDPEYQNNTAAGYFSNLATTYIPEDAKFNTEHRPEFLGGVTVLHGEVRRLMWQDNRERTLRATFIPYGVWNNRKPGAMRIWLCACKEPLIEMLYPEQKLGESCIT